MQTTLAEFVKDTPQGREADAILRKCVHCGFCLATCPTYQLLGDELDSPRGRIYLIKQMLEGERATDQTQLHLDRCLTCRACETTCPSGVQYSKLLDIGRSVAEARVERAAPSALTRYLLRKIVPYTRRFALMLGLARAFAPLLPRSLRQKLPGRTRVTAQPRGARGLVAARERTVVILSGCVQPVLAPEIDAAAMHVLDRLGIVPVRASGDGCCGAVAHHLSAHEQALEHAKRNIDAFWPHVERGAEAIVVTASACSAMLKDYGSLLKDDPRYAERAARVSEIARDISEVIAKESAALEKLLGASKHALGAVSSERRAPQVGSSAAAGERPSAQVGSNAAGGERSARQVGSNAAGGERSARQVGSNAAAGERLPPPGASGAAAGESEAVRVAFHSPCSLQHGLKIKGVVESLLSAAGYALTPVADAHLCCGSAGTYSILQPELSTQLLNNKVSALEQGAPAVIATANIGCLSHLRCGASVPVRHWIELIAARLS